MFRMFICSNVSWADMSYILYIVCVQLYVLKYRYYCAYNMKIIAFFASLPQINWQIII